MRRSRARFRAPVARCHESGRKQGAITWLVVGAKGRVWLARQVLKRLLSNGAAWVALANWAKLASGSLNTVCKGPVVPISPGVTRKAAT